MDIFCVKNTIHKRQCVVKTNEFDQNHQKTTVNVLLRMRLYADARHATFIPNLMTRIPCPLPPPPFYTASNLNVRNTGLIQMPINIGRNCFSGGRGKDYHPWNQGCGSEKNWIRIRPPRKDEPHPTLKERWYRIRPSKEDGAASDPQGKMVPHPTLKERWYRIRP